MSEGGAMAGTEVRVEAIDLESRIVEVCRQNPKGITNATIQAALPNVDVAQYIAVLNRLLSRGKIELLKQGSDLRYRIKDIEGAKSVKGADAEDKLVYQIIENAGNKGIWIRDIRVKSNLQLTQVDKILRRLEGKRAIKAVKSVAQSKRKVYMLYDVEPDPSVTGGSWYSDQDFEVEFVKVLNEQCFRFLKEKLSVAQTQTEDPILQRSMASASSNEILEYITGLGISKVQLSLKDIESILNTLIFDGKASTSVQVGLASSSADQSGQTMYRSIRSLVEPSGLVQTPCGVCPLIRECCPGGIVSPSKCPYLKEWQDYI